VALVGEYLAKFFWPLDLSAFYVFHKSTTLLDLRVLGGLAALALLAVAFVWLWRRERIASFGIVWFLVTLAPVLNARWMAANVFAERYLYLPSVGLCWVLGWLIARLVAGARSRGRLTAVLASGALALVAVLCAVRIYARNRDWRNDIVLYTETLAASPDAYPILNNLGKVYWTEGNADAAERVWRQALELAPRNAIIWNNLGLVFEQRKNYPQAVRFFEQASQLKPNYTDPHLNLGTTFEEMGRLPEAEEQLRAAVALAPLSTSARNELAKLDVAAGRLSDAEEQFRRSADSQPNGVAYDGLGEIYQGRGDAGRAEQAFRRALALDAFDSRAHFGLAELARRAGRNAEAVREYQAGLETDPHNAEALAALAALGASNAPDSEPNAAPKN
jgi:protein O-mannosyl-transferase